ncbi:MAG: hypothetical protein ACR2N7_09795 [Acidimicrobiia bacterium]
MDDNGLYRRHVDGGQSGRGPPVAAHIFTSDIAIPPSIVLLHTHLILGGTARGRHHHETTDQNPGTV